MKEHMLEWLREDSGTGALLFYLRNIKAVVSKELKDASRLDTAFKALNAMKMLVGEEKAERAAEHQLLSKFRENEAKLRKKSNALTDQLKDTLLRIAGEVGSTFYDVMQLEEHLKAGELGKAAATRAELLNRLAALEKEIKATEQFANYLSIKLEPVQAIYCSAEFRKKLRETAPNIAETVQALVIRMSNRQLLLENSKKLQWTRENLYSFPKGEKLWRIIFTFSNNNAMVYDFLTHGDYDALCNNRGTSKSYHGPFLQLASPIKAFAAMNP